MRAGSSGRLVLVGYMDPGNWATDIEGGSVFGCSLLFVVLLSSLPAMLLQVPSMRLGIVSQKDLVRYRSATWLIVKPPCACTPKAAPGSRPSKAASACSKSGSTRT
jgi:hypothetical protein